MSTISVIEDVWIYILKRKTFTIRKGVVHVHNPASIWAKAWYSVASYDKGQCSPNEGEVRNGIIWLRQQDDQKAKDIFRKYLLQNIKKHKKTIKNAQDSIKALDA